MLSLHYDTLVYTYNVILFWFHDFMYTRYMSRARTCHKDHLLSQNVYIYDTRVYAHYILLLWRDVFLFWCFVYLYSVHVGEMSLVWMCPQFANKCASVTALHIYTEMIFIFCFVIAYEILTLLYISIDNHFIVPSWIKRYDQSLWIFRTCVFIHTFLGKFKYT